MRKTAPLAPPESSPGQALSRWQGYRTCFASISAVIPGAAQHPRVRATARPGDKLALGRAKRDPRVVRCRPATQVPRHQTKGTAGVLGSRLSLRSDDNGGSGTICAIALPLWERGFEA